MVGWALEAGLGQGKWVLLQLSSVTHLHYNSETHFSKTLTHLEILLLTQADPFDLYLKRLNKRGPLVVLFSSPASLNVSISLFNLKL